MLNTIKIKDLKKIKFVLHLFLIFGNRTVLTFYLYWRINYYNNLNNILYSFTRFAEF